MESQSPVKHTVTNNSSYYQRFKTWWLKLKDRSPIFAWSFAVVTGTIAASIIFVLSLFLLVRIGAYGKLPSTAELKAVQSHTASEVYSIDGVLLGKYYIENRTIVDNEHISQDLINALIATEDARFFEHKGIDLRAWVRVFLRTVLMNDSGGGGGSTLSQQLAKNLFPRKEHIILTIPINKIKEMYTARRLEKAYSKEDLINLYLNTVPFGGNVYGVEVAAQTFFDTPAQQLKTEQSAVLIGMLKANTYYNPVRNPENSKNRRNVVLSQMAKYGYLDKMEGDSLRSLPLEVKYSRDSNNEGLGTYFREHLRQELAESVKSFTKPDGTVYNLYTDGLKIYTSIHSKMQRYAEESVAEQMKELQKSFDKHWKNKSPWGSESVLMSEVKKSARYKHMKNKGADEETIMKVLNKPVSMTVFTHNGDETKKMSPLDSIKYYYAMLNAGFMVTDHKTGQIKAWVGGVDHQYFKYDHVKSKRQVGSTFKPIVYASAIKNGFRPCDYYHNRLVTYTDYEDWQPQNADGQYGGLYSMEGAIRKSINSVAVDLIIRNGVEPVHELAQQMGITSDIPKVPAIALGTVDASLYDMMKVYGTIANQGKRPETTYLLRIENSQGKVLENYEEEKVDFSSPLTIEEAQIMTHLMEAVVDSGTARRLRFQYGVSGSIAGKTGTTQSHADGWFIGFTPRLVAGAWVGGEYPSVRFRSLSLGQGGKTALPIWGRFMRKLYKDDEFKKWQYERFPALSPNTADLLDCDPYLEEMPAVLVDGDIENTFEEALEELLNVFKKDKEVNKSPSEIQRQRRQQESDDRQREHRRIDKQNEKVRKKRARKKKRKKVWDKLFKSN